jgi:hypothetical protein
MQRHLDAAVKQIQEQEREHKITSDAAKEAIDRLIRIRDKVDHVLSGLEVRLQASQNAS